MGRPRRFHDLWTAGTYVHIFFLQDGLTGFRNAMCLSSPHTPLFYLLYSRFRDCWPVLPPTPRQSVQAPSVIAGVRFFLSPKTTLYVRAETTFGIAICYEYRPLSKHTVLFDVKSVPSVERLTTACSSTPTAHSLIFHHDPSGRVHGPLPSVVSRYAYIIDRKRSLCGDHFWHISAHRKTGHI